MSKKYLIDEYGEALCRTEDVYDAISQLTDGNIAIAKLLDLYADCRIREEKIAKKLKKIGINSHAEAIIEMVKLRN